MKFNVFVKPSAEPNAVRTLPRRENEERNSTFSSSRAQNRTQFGLYRGEKTKNEIQRFLRVERAEPRRANCASARKRRL